MGNCTKSEFVGFIFKNVVVVLAKIKIYLL